MDRHPLEARRNRPLRAARAAAAAFALAAGTAAGAASVGSAFKVHVTLFPEDKNTVECDRQTSGSRVSVTCVPPNDTRSNPRFLLQVFRADHWLGDVDALMATGTVTSWRVVRGTDREYVEIVVGW